MRDLDSKSFAILAVTPSPTLSKKFSLVSEAAGTDINNANGQHTDGLSKGFCLLKKCEAKKRHELSEKTGLVFLNT